MSPEKKQKIDACPLILIPNPKFQDTSEYHSSGRQLLKAFRIDGQVQTTIDQQKKVLLNKCEESIGRMNGRKNGSLYRCQKHGATQAISKTANKIHILEKVKNKNLKSLAMLPSVGVGVYFFNSFSLFLSSTVEIDLASRLAQILRM